MGIVEGVRTSRHIPMDGSVLTRLGDRDPLKWVGAPSPFGTLRALLRAVAGSPSTALEWL